MLNKLKSKITAKYGAEDRRAFPLCYLMILIPFLQFLVFWVFVNANSVFLAFQDDAGNFTLNNFAKIITAFKSEDMYGWNLGRMLLRSFVLWFSVNIICTPLIMLSTYVLYRKIFGHYVFRTIFAIPEILGAIIWTRLMSFIVSANGPILSVLTQLGANIPAEVVRNGLIGTEQTAYITLILINVIPHLIACNIILTGAFGRIPPEIFESSKIDGTSFIREFITIAVPLAWPTIVINLITALATIFTADGQVFLYTMGKFETGTVGFYLYYMVYRISNSVVGSNSFGYPAAVGVFFTAITLPVILIGKRLLEKAYEPVDF